MLGYVKSKFHIKDSWQDAPESSRYKSVEPQIRNVADGEVGPEGENFDDFPRRFVGDILKGASGQVWRGAKAQTVKALGHAPMSLLVCDGPSRKGLLRWVTVVLTRLIGRHARTRQWIGCHGKECREKVAARVTD